MKRAILLGVSGLMMAVGDAGVRIYRGASGGGHGRRHAGPLIMPAAADTPWTARTWRGIVRNYLLENPEILLEMQQVLEAKQKEEQRVANQVIRGAQDEIFNAAYDGVVGNPDGKTTIVEFYDYNCGYCKRARRTCRR